jgi:hypothetical protein
MIYALYEEQQVKKSHSQYSLNCYIIW